MIPHVVLCVYNRAFARMCYTAVWLDHGSPQHPLFTRCNYYTALPSFSSAFSLSLSFFLLRENELMPSAPRCCTPHPRGFRHKSCKKREKKKENSRKRGFKKRKSILDDLRKMKNELLIPLKLVLFSSMLVCVT